MLATSERFFGDFELQSNQHYEDVWAADASNEAHTQWNIESVQSVLERGQAVVKECEERFKGKSIVLVSHGDWLQILQTSFAAVPAAQHRRLPHLHNCEIRCLNPQ